VQTVQGCHDILCIPENAKTDDRWEEGLGTMISLQGEEACLMLNCVCVCVCVRGDIPVHFIQARICKPTAQTAGILQFVPLSRKMSNIIRLAVQKKVTAVYSSSHLYWLMCDPIAANCIISGASMGV
jgi:hypothetical protein